MRKARETTSRTVQTSSKCHCTQANTHTPVHIVPYIARAMRYKSTAYRKNQHAWVPSLKRNPGFQSNTQSKACSGSDTLATSTESSLRPISPEKPSPIMTERHVDLNKLSAFFELVFEIAGNCTGSQPIPHLRSESLLLVDALFELLARCQKIVRPTCFAKINHYRNINKYVYGSITLLSSCLAHCICLCAVHRKLSIHSALSTQMVKHICFSADGP